MNQSFRQQARQKLVNHSNIYSLARSTYRVYCKLMGSFHVLPDFLIIGAARSGTTSLYEYLMQHPCVEPCIVKQLHYFDTYFNRGTKWYQANFPLKTTKFYNEKFLKNKFITGEATPYYLQNPNAPRRVFELIPNSKIIVLLRNPVDRAYSHYQRRLKNGTEKLSFEEVTEHEDSRIKGEMEKMQKDEKYFSLKYHQLSYISAGLYEEHLKRWMQFFPKNQIMIIQSEDFFKNSSKIFSKVLNFLELPEFHPKKYKQYQKMQYVSTSMNPKTRTKLIEFCKPYNQRLYSLLDQRFDWEN